MSKMNRYKLFFFCGMAILMVSSCGQAGQSGESKAADEEQLLVLSQQQFDANKMKLGEVTTVNFTEEIKCNGYVKAPAGAMALLSSPAAGKVESVHCGIGDYVRKGQIVCTLYNNEVIVLQQDFAEASARLKSLKADYGRSKALLTEKVGSEKDFMAIESEYKAMAAKYESLKLRVAKLGLDTQKIEAGELFDTFPVHTPLSGYVTSQEITLGQFVEQQKNIMEIVDISKLQLQLSMYESAIGRLSAGQEVLFSHTRENDSIHHATLVSVGKAINPDTKALLCIAKLEQGHETCFVNNSYVDASVVVGQVQSPALPEAAFVKSGPDYYVFELQKEADQKFYLKKVLVKTGKTSGGQTEILEGAPTKKVLVAGAYNLGIE
jgi:cobalt-zinc-cadmium efflux system membrane fusion protein